MGRHTALPPRAAQAHRPSETSTAPAGTAVIDYAGHLGHARGHRRLIGSARWAIPTFRQPPRTLRGPPAYRPIPPTISTHSAELPVAPVRPRSSSFVSNMVTKDQQSVSAKTRNSRSETSVAAFGRKPKCSRFRRYAAVCRHAATKNFAFYNPNADCSCCFFLDSGAFLKVSSVAATVVGRSMPLPSINSFTVRNCRCGYFCRFVLCS
jgi:hypothetical protein